MDKTFIMQFLHFSADSRLVICFAGVMHRRKKGVQVMDIFKYNLCNVFADRSMYMQQKTGSFRENFLKNTYYRFLNSPKTNWLRFILE